MLARCLARRGGQSSSYSRRGLAAASYSPVLSFRDPMEHSPTPTFRVMAEDGSLLVEPAPAAATEALALALYETMVRVQAMDNVLFDAQRQGRLSFYMCATCKLADGATARG